MDVDIDLKQFSYSKLMTDVNKRHILTNAKEADQRTKDVVFGFTRETSDVCEVSIPIMITYICLSYYMIQEQFKKIKEWSLRAIEYCDSTHIGDECVLNQKNKTDFICRAHGTYVIDLKSSTNYLIEWVFKLNTKYAVIGLFSLPLKKSKFYWYKTSNGDISIGNPSYWRDSIGTIGPRRIQRPTKFKCDKGDTIRMMFSTKHKVLLYYKNDANDAFTAIPIDFPSEIVDSNEYYIDELMDVQDGFMDMSSDSKHFGYITRELTKVEDTSHKLSLWTEVHLSGSIELIKFNVFPQK